MAFLKSNLRRIVQLVFFLYIIGIGVRFFMYVQAVGAGNMDVTRPPGVEGFLPISALLGLKQFVILGRFDSIHPAGLIILLTIIAMSLIIKKSFCSHVCPVGFVSELLSKPGKKFVIPVYIPVWILKYILLGFFVYIILTMDTRSVEAFIQSPYNIVSDAKMMYLFLPPSATTVTVLLSLVILTLIFRNFWCKYLCPYGALLGLVSVFSPVKVKRDKEACIHCKKCTNICPQGIKVHTENAVHHPDCIGCHECVKHRQNEKCLNTSGIKYRFWLPALAACLFLIVIALGMISGNWQSGITNEQYQRYLMMDIGHP